MLKLSGWHRLLIVSTILWGSVVCVFFWKIYKEKETEIYGQWYSDVYTLLNDESYSWIDNPELAIPELIKVIEKKLLNENCKPGKNQFCDIYVESTKAIRNKYEVKFNNIFTLKDAWYGVLFWILPIILIYLIAIAIKWIYRGFSDSRG